MPCLSPTLAYSWPKYGEALPSLLISSLRFPASSPCVRLLLFLPIPVLLLLLSPFLPFIPLKIQLWLPVRQRVTYIQDSSAHIQIFAHRSARPPIGPVEWLHTDTPTTIIWLPPAFPASRQHSVRQPCLQFSCSSYLEQFTTIHSNSAICQHLQTTLEDLSVLLHHCHWLTNRTVRTYDSNPVWHMARYKCCLLTYLLTLLQCLYSASCHNQSETSVAAHMQIPN